MADKKTKLRKFQVKFAISSIIGLEILAADSDAAIAKANEIVNKGVFVKGIERIDGKDDKLCGFDDISLWNENGSS